MVYFCVSVLGVYEDLRFIRLSLARWLLMCIELLWIMLELDPPLVTTVLPLDFGGPFEWAVEFKPLCLAFVVFLATGFDWRW